MPVRFLKLLLAGWQSLGFGGRRQVAPRLECAIRSRGTEPAGTYGANQRHCFFARWSPDCLVSERWKFCVCVVSGHSEADLRVGGPLAGGQCLVPFPRLEPGRGERSDLEGLRRIRSEGDGDRVRGEGGGLQCGWATGHVTTSPGGWSAVRRKPSSEHCEMRRRVKSVKHGASNSLPASTGWR